MPHRLDELIVELDGTAQQVSGDAFRVRDISFQARPTNANPVFISRHNTVSSTVWGMRLPSGEGPPIQRDGFEDGSLLLSDFWVLGTAGEFLHVSYIRYL